MTIDLFMDFLVEKIDAFKKILFNFEFFKILNLCALVQNDNSKFSNMNFFFWN